MSNLLFFTAKALHVPALLLAFAIFFAAFAVGLLYLWEERQMKSKHPSGLAFRLPSLEELDLWIYRLIRTAVPLLALGILLGSLWAYRARGRFWDWEHKETWALITLLVYLIYLNTRIFGGWRGRKTAYLSLAGFAFILFTYVGANYASLHLFFSGMGR